MWNIDKSLEYLDNNVQPKSIGKCASYVRKAIEAGGLSTEGRPVSAYMYKDFLPKIGFTEIAEIKGRLNQSDWTLKNAKPGDIAVMEHGKHGHICMFNGKKWVSDFIQNNMWVYKGEGICKIFRIR